FQRSSVPAFQRSSVPAFQRSSVPAFQRSLTNAWVSVSGTASGFFPVVLASVAGVSDVGGQSVITQMKECYDYQ
ncbi:MAG: hypothetical protein LBK76_11635, partial [Verrucomicrobiales bacterium]|nr:hypothetical protein [Verrucomicrobiales bacterium]